MYSTFRSNTTFSPQGRLHQVEYALEAVKQGSAAVGLRSKTHVVLLALKVSWARLLTGPCCPGTPREAQALTTTDRPTDHLLLTEVHRRARKLPEEAHQD